MEDLTGRKFGRLLVTSFNGRYGKGGKQYKWNTICDCGNVSIINRDNLKSGDSRSCGCLKKELAGTQTITHGHAGMGKQSKAYVAWLAMNARTKNKNKKSSLYHRYGGRGIKVCRRWRKFENFYKDMGESPIGTSLDRINNNKGYSPKNCRWATSKEQNRNKRTTKLIVYKSKKKSLADWCDELELSYGLIIQRINKLGWDTKKAFTTKPRLKNSA